MIGGRYDSLLPLGTGGQGQVFRAVDRWHADLPVAIKRVLLAERSTLVSEFGALSALIHPSWVRPIDFLVDDTYAYLVEELVDGEPLAGWAKWRSEQEIFDAFAQIGSLLAHLHVRGFVHGDVQPQNILICGDRAVLIDAGMAGQTGETRKGGTPGFTAPEILAGRSLQPSADVFGLGQSLAFALTGGQAVDDVSAATSRDFLRACVASEPSARPSSLEVAERFASLGGGAPHMDVPRVRGSLVGREDEKRRFEEFVSGTERVFSWGGLGKTAMLTWCTGSLLEREYRVVQTAAALPLTSLLRQLVWVAPQPVLDELGADLAVHINHPRLSREQERPSTIDRTSLVSLLLQRISAFGPVAVVVDDVDDASDWQLWLELQACFSGTAVKIVTALTDGGHTLLPLEEEAIGKLLLHSFAREPEPERIETLLRETGGNPGRLSAAITGSNEDQQAEVPASLVKFQRWGRPAPRAAVVAEVSRDDISIAEASGVLVMRGDQAVVTARADEKPTKEDLHALLSIFETYQSLGDVALVHCLLGDPQAALRLSENVSGAERLEIYAQLKEDVLPDASLQDWLTLASAQGNADTVHHVATLCEKRGLNSDAVAWAFYRIADYEQALDILNRDERSHPLRARILFAQGKVVDARQESERALEIDPADVDALEIAGHTCFALGDDQQAEVHLETCLEGGQHDASVGRAHNALGILRQRQGRYAEAESHYRTAVEIADPETALGRQLNLATVLQDAGRLEDAEVLYESVLNEAMALQRVASELRARVNLGACKHLSGELSEALDFARGAVRLADEHGLGVAAVRGKLLEAEVLCEQHRLGEAADVLQEVVHRDELSQDTTLSWELGLVQAKHALRAGQREAARRFCEDTLNKQPEPWWKARLQLTLARSFPEADSRAALDILKGIETSGTDEVGWQVQAVKVQHLKALGENPADERRRGRGDLHRWLAGVPNAERYLAPPGRAELRLALSEHELGSDVFHRLLRLNRQLARARKPEELLETIVDTSIDLVEAERGFLVFRDADEKLNVAVSSVSGHRKTSAGSGSVSRSIVRSVFDEGVSVLSTDAQADTRFAGIFSVADLNVRSVVAVPLRGARQQDDVLGVLYIDHRFEDRAFTPRDVELCEAFADQASIALEQVRLLEETESQRQVLADQNNRLSLLNENLQRQVARQAEASEAQLRQEEWDEPALRHLIGQSRPWRAVLHLVRKFAEAEVPVIIGGESGTGKEGIARALHDLSHRSGGPFVVVNCAAIPEKLFESELFGHVRGAFTGAVRSSAGLIAAASGGTLFLDEIAELPMPMQAKLLRVLQEREYRPIGSNRVRRADVRIVAATHADLSKRVLEQRFREDLLYRLEVAHVPLPPLRERGADIPLLVEHFCRKYGGRATDELVEDAVVRAWAAYDWPGNVRELENEVQRALALADGTVKLADISEKIGERGNRQTLAGQRRGSLKQILESYEREVLLATLERCEWNVRRSATELGLSRASLYTRLNRFGIKRESMHEED